jgi:hypothetical protein
LVINPLIFLVKFFLRPTGMIHLHPTLSSQAACCGQWNCAMPIDAPLAVRAADESRRQSAREAATQYLLSQADARRDTRIEEAKSSAAARPTVSERAAENPPRPRAVSASRILDVLT